MEIRRIHSEQEQDAIVGRLIRERSEALRVKAALDAELKLIRDTCDAVIVRGHVTASEEAAGKLEPIRKYFNIDAYLELLQQRQRVHERVVERIKQLRELGLD